MSAKMMSDAVPATGQAPSLKVGYVVNTYPRPSQTFIRREIRAVESQGVKVYRFAMRRDPEPLQSDLDKAEQDATSYILDAGAGRLVIALLRGILRRPKALRAAIRAGRAGGPGRGVLRQLIYLAEGAVLADRARAAGLQHLHAHFGTNSTDVVRYCRLLGGPGYSFTVHGPEEFDAPNTLLLKQKVSESKFAVSVSAFGRSQMSRWTPFACWNRLRVVHCGIDPAHFPDPAPLPAGPGPGQPLRLVCIGRFAEQKGQMLLIEAMARATADAHLTLLGDGPLGPELRAAIAAHDLSGRVDLPGWADEAGVRDALSAAHVMIMPSFAEGLPVALMEAMAAGRPAIATLIAGIPELMVDGRTGWLVPAGDVGALAAAIDAAASTSPDRLRQMGLSGRERALARHDIHVEAAKLARLFRSCQQD